MRAYDGNAMGCQTGLKGLVRELDTPRQNWSAL